MSWNNSQAGGFGATQTDGTPVAGFKQFDKQSCVPATIKMLKDAPTQENSKMINGEKLSFISMVALVHEVERKETFTLYKIDDSTGFMEVRAWCNDGEESFPGIEENKYVKILAKVNVYNDKVQLNAMAMFHIDSSNAITHHMISVAHAHLDNKQKSSQGGQPLTNAGAMQTGGQGMGSYDDNDEMSDWNQCAKDVYRKVQELQKGSPDGAHIPTIIQQLSQHSASSIREAVQFLMNQGMMYDTISEDYVKTSDEC